MFGRVVEVEIGQAGAAGRRLTGLRVAFDVTLTRKARANTGKITVYNPAPGTVEAARDPASVIRLFAGYADNGGPKLVIQGNPIRDGVREERQGPDRVLHLEIADGGAALAGARYVRAWARQVTSREVLEDVARALGVAPSGGLPAALASTRWPEGLTLEGRARDALETVTAAAGCTWTIRDGVLVVVEAGGGTLESAPRLTPRSGLIGEVTRTREGVEVRALLDAAIRPCRRIVVEAASASGVFVVDEVHFVGDSGFAAEFYAEASARPSA